MTTVDLPTLLTQLQTIGQRHNVPEDFLEEVLPALRAALPQIKQIHVLRHVREGLASWASTDTQADNKPITERDEMPLHDRALDEEAPIQADNRVVIPLQTRDAPFGLLEIEADDASALPETTLLQTIAQQLSLILENKQLYQLLQRQVQTSAQLNSATSFKTIGGVLALHMVERGQYVSINVFDFDANGRVTSGRVVATANQREAYETQEPIAMDAEGIESFHRLVHGSAEMFIRDVATDERLNETTIQWLQSHNIQSMYQVPLRAGGRTFGSISINDTQRAIVLSTAERQIYRNLADQVAVNIEKQNLLQQTENNLAEARTLYNLTREMIQAEQIPDVLRVIKRYVGQGAQAVDLMEIVYDEDGALQTILMTNRVDADDNTRPAYDLSDDLSHDLLVARHRYATEQQGKKIEIIQNETEIPADYPLRDILLQRGVGAFITIPIFTGDNLRDQIVMTWDEPREFPPDTRRLLETIQTQVSIVLQNRQLLQTVQESAAATEQRVQVLQLLNELTTRITSEQEETALFELASRILVEATHVDHVGITLFDGMGEFSTLVGDYPKTGILGHKLRIDSGVPDILRETQQPFIVPSIVDEERIQADNRQTMRELGIQSAFFLPMYDVNGEIIGSVGFDSYVPVNEFEPETIDLAQTLVAQLVISLQNMRLLANSQRQATQMQQIAAFGQNVQATLEIDAILRIAAETSTLILDFDHFAIYWYEDSQLFLRVHNADGGIQIETPGKVINAQQNSVAHTALAEHTLRTLADLDTQHPAKERLRSLLVAPLVTRGNVYGVIECGSAEAAHFSQTDVAAFRQLSNQLAVALMNAQTYAYSQRTALNKVRANDIASILQQQLDLSRILSVTLEELGKSIGAKRARIRLGTDQNNRPT